MKSSALSNAWLTADFVWARSQRMTQVDVTLMPQGSGNVATCRASLDADEFPTGTTLKTFCSLSLDPGQKIVVQVRTSGLNACDVIGSINATLKMTNQEMIEPE